MSLRDLVILLVVILGIVLFLYGSNTYDAVFGWAGVFMVVGGVIAYATLEVYGALRKRRKLETVES
jgi:membrane-bound ClpP family serine protease